MNEDRSAKMNVWSERGAATQRGISDTRNASQNETTAETVIVSATVIVTGTGTEIAIETMNGTENVTPIMIVTAIETDMNAGKPRTWPSLKNSRRSLPKRTMRS